MVERAVRGAATAALALFVFVGAVLSPRPLLVVAGCLVVAAGAVVVLLVRSAEGWPLTVGLAVVALAMVVLGAGSSTNLGWFALCVLAGWCALKAGTVQAVVLVTGMVALLGWQWSLMSDPGWGAWIAGTIFTLVVGVLARRQSELVDELREAQAGLADRARVEERSRIAREIHDVIGHSLTVSLLHVSSARLAVEEEPAVALAALEEAERLGRQSLAEVRQVVGLIHDDDGPGVTPLPGADQIKALVESVRRAGTPVKLEVMGSTAALTATTGLTAYRILQEALTNVVRHAPGAATAVCVEVGATETRLTVDSAGAPGPERPGALGILSMRALRSNGRTTESRPGWPRLARRSGTAHMSSNALVRVLLVDDQELILAGLRGILRARFGFEIVGELTDGAEVVGAAEAQRPDVVVMDVRMPVVDGVAATAMLREVAGAPPVLILTTFEDDEILAVALRAGAAGFLLKGVPAEDLQRAVRTVADGGSWLDPAVTGRVLATYRGGSASTLSTGALEVLTPREREVLALIGGGLSNTEIAAELTLGEGTVKTHVGHVFAKLGLRDRAAAVVFAFDHGLVVPGRS